MAEIIKTCDRYFKTRKKGLDYWHVPPAVRKDLLQFISELDMGKVNRGRRISESRQTKYLDLLKTPLEFFNKPTDSISHQDVERFEKALAADKIQSRLKKQPYTLSTKVDIRKALKIFLRWRVGEAKALDLVGWLDTRNKRKTPDYLSEPEIEKLLKGCNTAEQRFLVAVLFDSGARAEEFVNIRYEDVHLPEGQNNFVKITLKQEYSKTLGRTISLYWRYCTEAVQDYLKERIAAGIRAEDPVFAKNYDSMRMFLVRLGKRILGKHVHPHLLRHSSATYYAPKLNRQELCYRYGWRFSSNMPDIYISRAGMENKELDTKFSNVELGGLKDELAQLQQQTKIKDERIVSLQQNLNEMQKNMAMIAEVLAMKPTMKEVERALEKKRKAKVEIRREHKPSGSQPED
jgi:integrase